jgi:hypothetical protein
MGVNTIGGSGGGSSAVAQTYEQYFASSGTWTAPAGVKTAEITCIGGGGGAEGTTTRAGGGGGYAKRIIPVTPGAAYSIVVGAGGVTTPVSNAATAGGTSSFGTVVYAYGGRPANTTENGNNGTANSGNAEVITQATGNISKHQLIATISTSTRIQNSIAAGNGLIVVKAGGGNTNYSISTDGFSWTNKTNLSANSVGEIAFGVGQFVTLGSTAGTTGMYSPDTVTWTTSALPTSQTWSGVVFGNGVFVAYSTSTTTTATSTNGTTWTGSTITAIPGNIVFAGSYFFAGQSGSAVRYSTNGTTWTAATGGSTSGQPLTVYYLANGTYVMFDQAGTSTYWTSTNGTTWTARNMPTTIYSAAGTSYSNNNTGAFVANNRLYCWGTEASQQNQSWYSSTDGTNWSAITRLDRKDIGSGSTASDPSFQVRAVYQLTPNRAIAVMSGEVRLFSDYFINGALGYFASSAVTGSYPGAAGAINGPAGMVLAITSGTAVSQALPLATGTPEGYAQGGSGVEGFNTQNNNYGCGASSRIPLGGTPTYPTANGGQGLVIVKWSI